MNKSSHPPIALIKTKSAYGLWFQTLAEFPKVYRYNLGGKIEGYFLLLLESLFIASYLSKEKKIAQLSIVILKLDNLKFFTQLAWENKCISNDKYSVLSENLNEIGRMVGGWKRGLEKQNSPE